MRQVEQICTLLGDGDMATLLLGDFNEWRMQGCLAPLEQHLARVTAPPTFPSPYPIARLDRVFASRGLRISHVHAHRSRSARVASDHLPLVATLERA
jgi:endonuclease/exonuclease/phosphatase family metal-dependent hydrolase